MTLVVVALGLGPVHAQSIKSFPLDEHTVYHLKVATDKVTTLVFPQPITALEGSGVTADPKTPAGMLLSYHAGDRFLSVRSLVDSATATLNIIINRKVYVMELATANDPFQSVTFYAADEPPAQTGAGPNIGPARLLGLLDKAKAYPLLAEQYPEMLSQIDKAEPFTRTLYRGYSVILTKVFRFDAEDALIFQVEFVNETDQPIYYVPQSLAVRVGPGVYWSALSDASGIITAGQKDPKTGRITPGHSNGYFVICGAPHGGRNHLSVQNNFNVLVFRQENNSMNARKFLDFFKTKTGQITAFGILFFIGACLLTGALYFRHGNGAITALDTPKLDKTVDKTQQPSTWYSHQPDAGFANKHPAELSEPGTTGNAPAKPVILPISLYHGNNKDEAQVSDTYAPYGRMIPCETVITIDSAKIETPIIGFVTEDVWHDGRLIIPAGAEVHGKAQVDPSRERIASDNNWVIVWRTTDRMDGAELPLHGMALDMERNETTGTWQLTDGSAGLKGDILKTDNWAEIKLFAATFLSAATTGLEDTTSSSNALTGQTTQTPLTTPKNAALAGTSAVLNQYAQQILDSIKRDGFYVRVPAGKQFYLYATQTIDIDNAKRGQSMIDLKPETQKP